MRPESTHYVHPAEFGALNEAFYAEDPAAYFRTRLSLLLALCDSHAVTSRAIEAGVTYGGISAKSPLPSPTELEGFAAIESVSLLHQVAETLMRLFFAHLGGERCPALALAGATNFRTFKASLASIRDQSFDDLLSEARTVFRGSDSLDSFGDLDESQWEEDGRHLIDLLSDTCRILLADSDSYNSFKHGLGIQASHPSFSIGVKEGLPFDYDGPAISYLHKTQNSEISRWSRTTSIVSIQANLAMIVLALEELEMLWTVGSGRASAAPITVYFKPADRRSRLISDSTDRGVLSVKFTQQFPIPT